MKFSFHLFIMLLFMFSCTGNKRESATNTLTPLDTNTQTEFQSKPITQPNSIVLPDTIIDANYTFEEAIAGSNAPEHIINQLVLFDVVYISTDDLIHKGQILTNKLIADDIEELFKFMLNEGFVIDKAIPIVRYNWSDSLSMNDNNSYSFCYRDISYSKHAQGMAIDINSRFNPLRYKYEDRPNEPEGAVLDTTVNGTLYPGHHVVEEFRRRGFRWGHTFTRYYDDHHFEKR